MVDFYNLSLKEASLFEGYQSKAYTDLQTALRVADETVQARILATKGEWTKTKLNDTKRLINEEISNSYGGVFSAMQEESVATAQIVLGAAVGNISADLPKATIADLINSNRAIRMSEDAVYGFKELFDLATDNHARQLRILLASGVAQGLTAAQIAKEYGIKSDKLSRGQVRTNIFTTISNSRDQGRYTAYKQLEDEGVIEGYIYDAVLDSGTTVYCRNHDQRKYFKKIEEIQGEIKVHANCRSVFRPLSDTDKRASQFGQVDSEPYKDWYLKQDDTFHKSTLANRQYNAFLKGRYKVNSLADLTKKNGLGAIAKELNR